MNLVNERISLRAYIPIAIAAFAFSCLSSRHALTDEAGLAPEAQWADAKQRYFQSLEKLRQTVVDHLAVSEKKARERGDLAKIKELKAELEAQETLN